MSPSGIFSDDGWQLVGNEPSEPPIFLRFRTGDPSPEAKGNFTTLVTIRWPFEPRDDSGLASKELMAEMDLFERIVLYASDGDASWGSLVAVVTTKGQREWRFYTPDFDLFLKGFNKALTGRGNYPLEIHDFDDPEWKGFEDIRKMAEF